MSGLWFDWWDVLIVFVILASCAVVFAGIYELYERNVYLSEQNHRLMVAHSEKTHQVVDLQQRLYNLTNQCQHEANMRSVGVQGQVAGVGAN